MKYLLILLTVLLASCTSYNQKQFYGEWNERGVGSGYQSTITRYKNGTFKEIHSDESPNKPISFEGKWHLTKNKYIIYINKSSDQAWEYKTIKFDIDNVSDNEIGLTAHDGGIIYQNKITDLKK